MKKAMTATVTALAALSCALTPVAASAQSRYRDSDGDGRSDYHEWNRDRDHDGRRDQYDRWDNRRDDHRGYYDGRRDGRWRYYGGTYGYDGYRGRWRTGQRFPYYNNDRYVIYDYRSYDLPPPRRGYRYYRDSNGDVIMAAIAGGAIGLILGGALSNDHHRRW